MQVSSEQNAIKIVPKIFGGINMLTKDQVVKSREKQIWRVFFLVEADMEVDL